MTKPGVLSWRPDHLRLAVKAAGVTLWSWNVDTDSVVLLSYSMRTLPLGTAYTIWTGIGAVGAFLVGILLLGEMVSLPRVAAAVLIVAGLVLMKLSTPA